jgi:hypothetical protein
MPALSITSSIANPMCNGGKGTISAQVLGGVETFTYFWSSTATYSIIPQPTPYPIFSDSLQNSFTLDSTLNESIVCHGDDYYTTYTSRFGYCSILVWPGSMSTLFSVGCSGCIDPSEVRGKRGGVGWGGERCAY